MISKSNSTFILLPQLDFVLKTVANFSVIKTKISSVENGSLSTPDLRNSFN